MRSYLFALVACAVAACTTPPPPPAPAPNPPAPNPPAALKIDFSQVFGGRSSGSIYDLRVPNEQTMARVLLEPATLSVDDPSEGIENWTRRKLVQTLGRRGSRVLAPPPPSCAPSSCYSAQPTAALRNLRLVSARDQLKVRVARDDTGALWVGLHRNMDDPSICPKGFSLKLGFVQLLGQLQALPGGEIAAVFHELALLDAPENPILEVALPRPEDNPELFCKSLAKIFVTVPGFAVDDARYAAAAEDVLRVGLHPLFPRTGSKPTPNRKGRRK